MQEPSGRCLKTVVLSVKDKEISGGPWKNISIDSQASLLHPLPLPLGGLVAIGYQTIAYYNKDSRHIIDPPVVKVLTWTLKILPIKLHVKGVSCSEISLVKNAYCMVGNFRGVLYFVTSR